MFMTIKLCTYDKLNYLKLNCLFYKMDLTKCPMSYKPKQTNKQVIVFSLKIVLKKDINYPSIYGRIKKI